VHDYFGEQVAIYFAWLGLYTTWLQYSALLGCLCQVGPWPCRVPTIALAPAALGLCSGCVRPQLGNFYNKGIDDNPLTLAYSMFVSLWSTVFLECWKRRENEFKWIWGSEGFEANEQPRPQFRGDLKRHPVTGISTLVHTSPAQQVAKKTLSSLINVLCMVIVIVAAFLAYSVRQIGEKPLDDASLWERRRLPTLSAVLNLVMIQGGGQVYKGIAMRLTVWENHRTDTDFMDSLILKNMSFEFVNNFFTLFYIAFFIEVAIIKDMRTGCEGASCMEVLQKQLMIVFTVKTLVKKAVEMLKPYLRAKLKRAKSTRSAQKSVQVRARRAWRFTAAYVQH
jgi:anoctamin-7